jgi:hypothetical protein
MGDVFCVLGKALFCVYHDVLLSKLNFCGITGKVYDWIKSYLRNMYQTMVIKIKNFSYNIFSGWGVTKLGVPQG